jgi:branched-chain amino acid transport system ATP-binding protein
VSGSTPVLEVRGLRKSFGRLAAVDGVDLSIARGEILGVAGPNGAGKSTLINLLTHIPFPPDGGDVLLDGHSIRHSSARVVCRRGLARTFQAESVFDTLSPYDNVRIAAAYGGPGRLGARELRAKVEAAFEAVGFVDPGPVEAQHLPPIDKKKLMIASAIATDPLVLCLDEPASGLIEPEQRELESVMREIRDRGVAILVVEHVLPLLRNVADRMIVMATGKVLAEGTPDDVLNDPRVISAYIGQAA